VDIVKRFISQSLLAGKAILGAFDLVQFICYQVGLTLLTLIFYCVLAFFTTGSYDLTRWVVGNSLVLCVNSCIYSLGTVFISDRHFGRLRFIIASPMNLLAVILQKGVIAILMSLGTVTGGFIIGGLIFGVDFTGMNFGVFLLAALAATFSAAGMGLMMSAVALLTDSVHLILNIVANIILILSGANFPITQLPIFVQYTAKIFPLHRAVAAANMSFGNFEYSKYVQLIIGEMALGICFYLIAFVMLKIMEKVAIKKASLEMF
jgi:ABC-2 type transport system permease protein